MADELIREDTMLYRAPTADSDETKVVDVWGRQLETKVVDAPEVESYLAEGWVKHPTDLDGPIPAKKPEEKAGFVPDRSKELIAAEAKADDLVKQLQAAHEIIATLQSDLKAAQELADGESKAKDEALAKLAALDQAKTTLGVKGKPGAHNPLP